MAEDKIQQATENMIKNLEDKTGKTLNEWIKITAAGGLKKHGELVAMLKSKHGLTHGYANLVVHKTLQSDAGSAGDDEDLVKMQYKGKEELLKFYEEIISGINAFGGDVELSPKKAYVSVRRKKQFAIIQPTTKTRLDVGINLKGAAPEGKLEAAGSFNSMCTHRVRIENSGDINKEFFVWLKQAYEQAG